MYLSYYKESPYWPKSQNVRGVTITTLTVPAIENKYYVTGTPSGGLTAGTENTESGRPLRDIVANIAIFGRVLFGEVMYGETDVTPMPVYESPVYEKKAGFDHISYTGTGDCYIQVRDLSTRNTAVWEDLIDATGSGEISLYGYTRYQFRVLFMTQAGTFIVTEVE